jgi:general secretion pathway protein D
MNADYRLKSGSLFALVCLLAIGLTGCAAKQAYTRGQHAEILKDFDTAMTEYKAALDKDPGNIEFQLKYQKARYNAGFQHFEAGRRALDKEDFQTAKMEFSRVLEIDPSHELARQQLDRVNEVLAARARNQVEPEIQFDQMRESTRTDPSVQAQLDVKITAPIDVHMTQDSRVAFESLAELAGLNVIFDPDFRGTRIPIDLNKVNIFDALDILALQTRSFWKPINRTTILVSGDNQTKRRDYEDLILKTIYLSNSVTSTEITEAITALRTLLNMRYLAQSTAMNAIIIRDTADRIAIAERIIEDLDKAKAEVLVDATVMEVDRNTLRQLGITPPIGTSTAPVTLAFTGGTTPTSSATTGTTTGTTTTTTTPTATGGNVTTLRNLGHLNSTDFSINIPPAMAVFLASSAKTKLLQNPQLRATDGKQASIKIGSQVPIASGSFQPAFVGATGTPVVNFQFVPVGVNLDITPRVLLNREVSMVVSVQVSALAGDRNVGGVTQPVLTNRQVQHEIRLAEGETNILGGIITDSEATSMSGYPVLKDIPVLKYFFAQEQKTRDETEIIIMLTPHILRMPNIQEANMRGLNTGSESFPRLRMAAMPAAIAPPAGAPAAPGPGAPAPGAPAAPGAAANQPPAAAPPTPALAPPNAPPQAARQTNSTLAFSPSPITLPQTGTTTVNIVGNGNDFYAVDLTISFQPGSFSVRDAREGGFLSRDGQIVAFVQRLDNEAGMLMLSLERPPGSTAVSGTGNLVTLVLERGMRQGNSTLRITDFRIRDPQQNVSVGKTSEVTISAP